MTKPASILGKLLLALASAVLVTNPTGAQDAGQTFAIQNVQTGKNLRPLGASRSDQTAIISYDAYAWKCMTWRFDRVSENTYRLQNVYTSKMLEPSPTTTLWQQPLKVDNVSQQWDLIPDGVDSYLIRLHGSELYVTATSNETNSAVVLLPRQSSRAQLWRLVPQNPWF